MPLTVSSFRVSVPSIPIAYSPVESETVEVVVDDGRTVTLSHGPKAGTLVVTTGANQVWGAELGVGH